MSAPYGEQYILEYNFILFRNFLVPNDVSYSLLNLPGSANSVVTLTAVSEFNLFININWMMIEFVSLQLWISLASQTSS
jgi:hypothetical protein